MRRRRVCPRVRAAIARAMWHGPHLQSQHLGPGRKQLTYFYNPVWQGEWNPARSGSRATIHAATNDGKAGHRFDFRSQDPSQLFVWFDQDKMIGRLQLHPLPQTRLQLRKWDAQLACGNQKTRNHPVKRQPIRRRRLGLVGPDVDSAAAAKLHPTLAFELAVSRADGVGMQVKAPRQIASTGEALSRREIVAQNAEHNLGHQLFADRNLAPPGKPELHSANILTPILGCGLHRLPAKLVKSLSCHHCRFSGSGSMMNRMSFSETIFLFFLALVIFGPKKLPEIARTVGKALNEFKRASNEFKAQIEQEISHLEVENRQTILPPSPTPEGVASRTLNSEPPATLAAPTHEPVAATSTEASLATEGVAPVATDIPVDPVPASDEVTSPTSQESHV
jgi:sec-independent protein translocase protein TatB